jgi:uncharacterized protein YggE
MKKENNAIVVASIIAGTIIVVTLLTLLVFVPMFSTTSNAMTVQGTSTIKVMPDLVAVFFNIQTNGTTSSAANDANTVIYNKLKTSLIGLGFTESQIGTDSYSVYPNIVYDNNGKATNNGYIAYHSIKLEFSANDTTKLSSVIDAGTNAGAGVSTINFELSTALQNQYKAQALQLASQDAKTKADAVAAGFGKSTGALVSVSVDNFDYRPWGIYTASGTSASPAMENAGAKAATMNLAPTTQDVSATVSATYKLA